MNALLIRIGMAAIVFALGGWLGYDYADTACQAKQGKAQTQAVTTHNIAAEVGQDVERKNVDRTVKTAAVFNGINQGVITYAQNHPSTPDCRLDDDGLRLWAAANANTEALPAAERDAALRGITGSAERGIDRLIEQSHRGRPSLSPVPRPTSRLGQLVGVDQ